MEGKDLLLRMIAFDRWANAEVRATVVPLQDKLPQAVTLLAHIHYAWEGWKKRIDGTFKPGNWFPTLSLAECDQLGRNAQQLWDEFLGSLDGDWTGKSYEATLLDGSRAEFTLTEIILQLVTHGIHHRGQINTMVRGAGGEPVNPTFARFAVAGKGK